MPTAIRRSIIAVLLVIALAAGYGLSRTGSGTEQPLSNIIEKIEPNDGDKTLQQGQVSVDLLTGWDGRLTIDQIEIPDAQVTKVRQQGTISFQPGPGKALEYFPAGQNCVTLTYWQVATGPDRSFQKTWCFTAV